MLNEQAVNKQKCKMGKPPGRDGIPSEIWKHGGPKLTDCLYKLIQEVWDTQKVPQDWKDASMVPLYKVTGKTVVAIVE